MYPLHYILNIIISIITKTSNLQQMTDIYRDFYKWVNVAMDSFDSSSIPSIHSFNNVERDEEKIYLLFTIAV